MLEPSHIVGTFSYCWNLLILLEPPHIVVKTLKVSVIESDYCPSLLKVIDGLIRFHLALTLFVNDLFCVRSQIYR